MEEKIKTQKKEINKHFKQMEEDQRRLFKSLNIKPASMDDEWGIIGYLIIATIIFGTMIWNFGVGTLLLIIWCLIGLFNVLKEEFYDHK